MLFTVLPLLKEGVSFPRACGLHLGELSDRSCAGAVCLESKSQNHAKTILLRGGHELSWWED